MAAADLDELAKKLELHKQQLTTVESLLKNAPDDRVLLKLQSDLRQVVALTEDLTKMKGVAPLEFVEETKWKQGDRCMALWSEDSKWYVARIDGASELATYTVTYLEYGNVAEVSEQSLRPYQPAPIEKLTEGTLVKAFWQDSFQPAVVVGPGPNGTIRVKFARNKKKKDLPAEDIILRDQGRVEEDAADDGTADGEPIPAAEAAAAAVPTTTARPAKAPVEEKFEIPEHLLPKPSDSEKVREQKRKKIKLLKSQHRKRKAEDEQDRVQNNWLQFQAKGRFGGSAALASQKKPKKSMFASPDSVEGRVGVVGSGRPMTAEQKRDKHFYKDGENDGSAAGGAAAPTARLPLPADIV